MGNEAGQLVGRARELELLDRELSRLGRDEGGVLQLVGEPGIGKTRIIGEALSRARSKGFTALVGRGDELQQSSPFAIFVDALDDHLAATRGELETWLAPSHQLQLGSVFPSLSDAVTGDASQLQSDRHRSYRAVRALLEQLGERRPLLLALDDLHWTDPGSLELFGYLVRNQPRGPVLIVAAQRPQPHMQLHTPGEIAALGSFEYLELEPLTDDEASALFPDEVDRSTRVALLELSGGNPFYLEQLARSAMLDSPLHRSVEPGAATVPDVPQQVVIAISSEIAALSDTTLKVLEAAAIVGDPFEADLVAEIAGSSVDNALAALDDLTERDLVRTSDLPRQFRFRHPIVRRAVYESAGPGWRLSAHARAAAALEARGAAPEERAHHVQRSARVGDELAIALLTKAAESNAWRSPATAASWFEAALSLLPEGDANQQRRLELTLQRAMALAAAGQLERSRDTLRELLRHLPRELTALRGQGAAVIAMVDQVLTNHEDAERLLQRTLHELPDSDLSERTMLRNVLAVGKMFQGDFDGARDWALQAVGSARKIDPSLNAASAAILALAEFNLGDIERSRQYVEEAATLIDTMPDTDLAMRLHGLPWLAWTEHWHDDLPQAGQHFQRGILIARSAGQTALLVPLIVGQAANAARRGRLDQAVELANEALELAHVCGSNQYLAWAHIVNAVISTQTGDLIGAVASGERAVAAVGAIAGSPMSALSAAALAEAKLESGLPDQCRQLLLDYAGGPSLGRLQRGTTSHYYDVLTRAELVLENIDAADRWARRAESDTMGLQGRLASAKHARASVDLAQGRPDVALRTALDAVHAAELSGAPIEAARIRILAGSAHAAAGDRDSAVRELQEALAQLTEAGAMRYADQAAHELRRLGKRTQRKSKRTRTGGDGVGALTDREVELSRLVATGKTNRQIAAELFISEKTVQNHLSSIFTKLGVSSRAGVAGIIERTAG